MVQNERLSAREFEALSMTAATRMALHAYDSSPFYRDLYSGAGLSRQDVSELQNFEKLPIVTKTALREAGDRVLSTAVTSKRALVSQTGGSTGAPLRVRNDAAAPTAAMWWRIYRWWDVHPGDDMAFIYRRLRHGREALRYAAQWWPSRHIHLDARAITDDAIEEFVGRWARVRPRLLVAYVEGATAVATHLARSGRTLPTTAVSVTAAMLQPGQRALLESVFCAPVYDTYRSAEIPWIAAECPQHEGLHVAGDQRMVEIVDDDGHRLEPGVEGSVVVTDFSNEVYPLVRYEMGDRSRLLGGECGCGRVFPRIDPVQGRLADVIRTPSGRRITGGLSGLFLGDPEAIRQMQIVQAPDYSITIRYVATRPGEASAAAAGAARALTALVGENVGVTTIEVASIESQGGKARLVVSRAPETL
ncbi:phenylacetate--CoA ligase family protein [Microbacterium paraoxydans]|uniref:phenylacetate--CoA ligase family protein n=1 Tax=Microbacterium paraoxydans TaxID=199592 RepID=UPI001CFC2A3E|nr:hypothetical protein [Microbacterium paraoxydans]